MKQDAFWANDPVAAPARPQAPARQPAAPAQFWANDPVASAPAAPAAPRRAPTGGGRQPAPAAAPPAMGGQGADTGALTLEESTAANIRQGYPAAEALRLAQEQMQYDEAVRPYTLPDGRVVNLRGPGTPVAMAGPRRADDIVVDGMLYRPTEYEPAVERLPMQGDILERTLRLQPARDAALRVPGVSQALSYGAGLGRGAMGVVAGAYGLLGQGADRLGLDGIGNAMIDQADYAQNLMDAQNALYQEANTGFNQAGRFVGETAASAPIGSGLGQGIRVVGQGVGRFAPQVGRGIEAFGRSTAAAGFTPSAVGRPAAGMAPSGLERAGNILLRGGGGATAGALGTALTAPDGGGNESGMLGMTDTQAGAAIGALLPTVAARPAKFAMNRLMDGYQALVGELGATRAANIVRQSLGVDYDAALVALRNARPDETAQQALVRGGVEPSVFMGVGAEVRGAAPDAYLAIEAAQQAAMEAPINRLAGGPNLTAAQMTQRAEKQALRAATVPEGEAALARAGATGRLDVDAIANQLMARADVPGVRANPEQVQALGNVAQQLRSMADLGGGVIEPADLYETRQRFITSEVNRLLNTSGTASPSALRAQEAEIRANIAPLIDDAIEAAGGTGWRQYLADYASGMRGVERQQMMGVAGRQLRQNPNTFANLVEGDAPDVVANVFSRNDTLANLMNPTGVGPSGMDALTSAAEQIRRNQRIDVLAGEGRGAAQELIRQGRNQGPIRGMATLVSGIFRPGTTAAMQVGSALLDAKISPQVRTALAQAYQSGANMTELLAMTPLADRAQVQRNLMNPAFWAHLQSGAVNAMINEDDVVISQAVDEQGNAMRPR